MVLIEDTEIDKCRERSVALQSMEENIAWADGIHEL